MKTINSSLVVEEDALELPSVIGYCPQTVKIKLNRNQEIRKMRQRHMFLWVLTVFLVLAVAGPGSAQSGGMDCQTCKLSEDDGLFDCVDTDSGSNECGLQHDDRVCWESIKEDGTGDCGGVFFGLNGRASGSIVVDAAALTPPRSSLGDTPSQLRRVEIVTANRPTPLRHSCTGAIMDRVYSAVATADMRAQLHRILIQ